MKKISTILLLLLPALLFAQEPAVYQFLTDDDKLKQQYYEEVRQYKDRLVSNLGKEHKDDYKTRYEERFKEVAAILRSPATVTSKEAHDYLQSVLNRIISVNQPLKDLQLRVVFSRDWNPNAYSTGDGTIVFNAGLLLFLNNEAEFAFVLCHELAHYYLDHGNKGVKKYVETINSEKFKAEIKRISKEEYRFVSQFEKLVRELIYDTRRHSRENEAEADRTAFQFLKNTGYDVRAIESTMRILDRVNDSLLFRPLNLPRILNFSSYPFKNKWVEKESVLFGDLKEDDSPLTKKEKDSLKTHPDCTLRLQMLKDSIAAVPSQGRSSFIVDKEMFDKLKERFIPEITEQNFREGNLGLNLYYSLLMIQEGKHLPYAVYSTARALNLAWQHRKDHRMGQFFQAENRFFPADYNLLLRMLTRVRLDELALVSYYFCDTHKELMKQYPQATIELERSAKIIN